MSVGGCGGGEIKWRRSGSSDGHELRKASPRRNSGKGWIQKKVAGRNGWYPLPKGTTLGQLKREMIASSGVSTLTGKHETLGRKLNEPDNVKSISY